MKKSNLIVGIFLVLVLLIMIGCSSTKTINEEASEETTDNVENTIETVEESEVIEKEISTEDVTEPDEDTEVTEEEVTDESVEETIEEVNDTTEDKDSTADNYRVISLKDLNVYPQELVIKVGTTVEWRNVNDNFQHIIGWNQQKSVYGVTPEPILAGESWSYTFEIPGEVNWFSTARPTLQGTITVEE